MWIRAEDGFLINMDHIMSVAIEQHGQLHYIQAHPASEAEDEGAAYYFIVASFETKAAADCALNKLWDKIKPLNVVDMSRDE